MICQNFSLLSHQNFSLSFAKILVQNFSYRIFFRVIHTMSFWDNNHPTLQDKYEILWNKYVPSCGRCYSDEAEALRLVSGVGYQLYNNGCWFGTGNYHVKEYMSQNICSAADDFMHMLDYLYEQSDEYLEDHAWNDLTDEEKEQRVEEAMEWVVDEAWERLADEDDKKELAKRERKKNAVAKKEERATKKRKREAARAEQQEEKKLRKLYKIHTGKRFRRKGGSSDSALEQLRKTKVEVGLTGMYPLSDVEGVKVVAPTAKINKFTPTVSAIEFQEYQSWQRRGRGGKPSWFMTDDAKAMDIMSHYKQVEEYYK